MGKMPIFIPLSGRWLNRAESIQRLLKRRALDGTAPATVQTIIDQFEAVARYWNQQPTPFTWAGKRYLRRQPSHMRRHPLGGSATITRRAISRRPNYYTSANQVTH